MSRNAKVHEWENNVDIQIFREYLRIPSVHPDIDYDGCVEFLLRQASILELPCEVIEVDPGKPVVLMTWNGTHPEEGSILLNSHMDVVPVYAAKWSYPPFSAHMTDDGKIYGRGSQDMKCVGIQFLAVIRALKREGVRLRRTVHVTFVPDEEIGGTLGMKEFVKTDRFKQLNVGFAIDEGCASENEVFYLFYAERVLRRVNFYISGTPGHGSLLLKNTAGEKARLLIDRMMDFRKHEETRLANNSKLFIGDVTTVNLTMMSGGVQSNVVPPELMLCFDIRVSLDPGATAMEEKIEQWCQEAGGGIRIEYGEKDPELQPTKLDKSNPFWVAFKRSINAMELEIQPQVLPGATDIRFLREQGIPALGFSPMNNTPILLHAHDEYLGADVFLKGIEIYKNIIVSVANVKSES
ncbi:aminoacylase-1-like [Uranotaenia lowii]|uniref:aminoacylase-1-like n=1 Tax=Uranotaenia lowii TaxID=190385 RepID=UPI0024797103|nr:aminoacylase-1-like [Uranotaenia lowii]